LFLAPPALLLVGLLLIAAGIRPAGGAFSYGIADFTPGGEAGIFLLLSSLVAFPVLYAVAIPLLVQARQRDRERAGGQPRENV
jgi:hypothetical protein